ncbi:MAG: SnoaL-like domain-containing protein [Phycisphaerales bacterium]
MAKGAKKKKGKAKAVTKTKGKAKRKGGGAKGAPKMPAKLTSGAGASPLQIGTDLVALFNAGKWDAPCKKWWSDKIESVEGDGQVWRGRKACEGKNAWWYSMFEPLGGRAEGPYAGATGFAVKFEAHVREKATGVETRMTEIGCYTVKGGKIVREEFWPVAAVK